MPKQIFLPPDRPIQVPNKTCPYCGIRLSLRTRRKEHVVGRRFVPKGLFAKSWNLHVWSCNDCNLAKSELEDDISSITLFGKAVEMGAECDPELREEAKRKAWGSKSRTTGKQVAHSHERITIRGDMGPIQVNATFTGPPQLKDDRVHRLALFQLRAFFYWLTFNAKTQEGRWWRGVLFPVDGTTTADFGNAIQTAFARRVASWDYRLIATTAGGYFQTAIRKHPTEDAWSFALEWNDHYRLIGFFGDVATCESERKALPQLQAHRIYENGPNYYAIRTNIPLAAGDDVLFNAGELKTPDQLADSSDQCVNSPPVEGPLSGGRSPESGNCD